MEVVIDYLAMDGYWPFVWPAYGVAAAVMIGLLASSLRLLRNSEKTLAALDRVRPRRRKHNASPVTKSRETTDDA